MFDDCARPTIGIGPPLVPNVMRRVPVCGGNVAPLVCAWLSLVSATMLTLINIVNRKDDNFCIFLILIGALIDRRIVGPGEGHAPTVMDRLTPLRSARGPLPTKFNPPIFIAPVRDHQA